MAYNKQLSLESFKKVNFKHVFDVIQKTDSFNFPERAAKEFDRNDIILHWNRLNKIFNGWKELQQSLKCAANLDRGML